MLVLLFILTTPLVSADVGLESGAIKLNKFLIIAGIGVFFLIAGLATDQSYFILGSMLFFFICGFIIQAGNLYLPNHEISYSYGNNFSYANGSPTYHWDYGDAPQFTPAVQNTPDSVFLFHTEEEYEAWTGGNSHLIGWLIMVLSIVFFALTLFSLRGDDY